MSETIIPAKRDHRIWVLNGRQYGGRSFDMIDVVAWAVPSIGAPVPITAMGRLEKNVTYMLAHESGWMVLPLGHVFTDSSEALAWLEAETRRRAA
jgi:hypothetical protein